MKITNHFSAKSMAVAIVMATLLSITLVDVHCLTEEQLELIEDHIQTKFMPGDGEGRIPGMGISIVHDGQVYSRGFGYRILENAVPATGDTLFGIGSLSKMLSALFIVHTLSEKFPALGEAVVDQPVNKLAPNLNLILNDRYRTEYTTFRDLLSHKTCISDLMLIPIGIGATNKSNAIYQQRYVPEFCHFRNIQFSYNQPMVQVAGEALASIIGDGRSFEELLIEFLRKLGMNSTRIIEEDDDYSQVSNMSQGYYVLNGYLRPVNLALLTRMSAIPAAAGVLTTPTDMTRLMQLVINRGRLEDGVLLVKEEVFDWISRISTPYRFDGFQWKTGDGRGPFGDLGYGLGWILGTYDGYQQLSHSGCNTPYEALVNLFPALKLGIFTSTSGGHGDQYGIHDLVVDTVLGYSSSSTDRLQHPRQQQYLEPDLLPRRDSKDVAMPPQVRVIPTSETTLHVNHALVVGSYGLPIAGEFTVMEVNGTTLYLRYGRWMTGYLTPRSLTPTIYDLEMDSDLGHMFDGELPVSINFAIPNVAFLNFLDGSYPFVKDFSLNDMPAIPWDPASCGPDASKRNHLNSLLNKYL